MTTYTNPVISTHREAIWLGGSYGWVACKNTWGPDGLVTSSRVLHRGRGFGTRAKALAAAKRWVKQDYHSNM